MWWETEEYLEGRQAYLGGDELEDCPYTRNGPKRDAWIMGWCDGEANDPDREYVYQSEDEDEDNWLEYDMDSDEL